MAVRLRRAAIALRIARRQTARTRGRSALIVALIALPVAGMAAVTLIIPSTVPTDAERLTVELGQTQARVHVVSPPNPTIGQDPFSDTGFGSSIPRDETGQPIEGELETVPRTPSSLFPAGTKTIPLLQTSATVETATGVATLNATEGAVWDPALQGRYDVVGGHAPQNENEIMVTASTLDRLGIRLGESVRIVDPMAKIVTVVGLIDSRSQPDSDQVIYGMPGAFTGDSTIGQNTQTMLYLPDTVIDWQQVKELNAQGALVLSREVFAHPPDRDTLRFRTYQGDMSIAFMLAGMVLSFGLLEVMLLAGAAFTVGAKAQERSLAIVASTGAERRTLFGIVSSSGLVLGLVGGIVGVAAGIGIGSLFMLLTDDGSATRYWGYHLWWPVMIGIALVSILIGWLGAVVPAVRASKIDVVAALRGARRPAAPRRRRPVIGVIVALAGIALTLGGGALVIALTLSGRYISDNILSWLGIVAIIAGPVVVQLGLIFCSGLVLRLLARLFSYLGVAARLASRDTARNPGRSVPALAVIMTTVFVAVLTMTFMTSSEATSQTHYRYSMMPGQVQVALGSWDQNDQFVAFKNPDDYAAALSANLDVDSARVLKAVPDPTMRPGAIAGDPKTLLPFVTVPPDNQCPTDPRSVDFDEATMVFGSEAAREAAKKAASDWRCQNSYPLSESSGNNSGHIWVGDAGDLALILGTEPSQAAKDALARGEAVSFYPEYVSEGMLSISWWPVSDWQQGSPLYQHLPATRTETVPAVVEKPAHPIRFGIFVPTTTADRLGLPYVDAVAQASTASPPTDAQLDALRSSLDTLSGAIGSVNVQVERGPANTATAFSWGILGLSGIIALGASAVAIGLARADGRRDEATLAAVGSSPRLRRAFGFWQVVMIAGVGSVLGAAVGLVPVVALTLPGAEMMFSAPWLPIVATAVLMPLAIACGTWLPTGRRRLQASRAAIE